MASSDIMAIRRSGMKAGASADRIECRWRPVVAGGGTVTSTSRRVILRA